MVIAIDAFGSQSRAMPKRETESILPPPMREAMKPEAIGYRLKLLRVALDMKPSEISDYLGIERTYWSRFENGKRAVSDEVAAALVAYFGVTLDFLILGREERLPLELAEKIRRAAAEDGAASGK